MNKKFLQLVLNDDVGKAAGQCGRFCGQVVHLIVDMTREAAFAGTATLSNACTSSETFVCRRLHSHDLPCSKESDQVVNGAPKAQDQSRILPYPYPLKASDRVPETLDDIYAGVFLRTGLLRIACRECLSQF